MGCVNGKPDYFDSSVCNGTAADYKSLWTEGEVLGEGEFGRVRIVTLKDDPTRVCAMKELKKGIQFKHNVAYSPMDPDTLKAEVTCLRQLQGQHYNLKLEGLYESPSAIYIVTELCTGGEMLQYVSQGTMKDGLRTEDISRISYQLLSAINHCASFGMMHRDIKPENTMFVTKEQGSELRLIDYGCASLNNGTSDQEYDTLVKHKTMSGTPFYLAPEVFQEAYTIRADVWSVGVTLLVLVAGFPADKFQRAFNLLHRVGMPATNKAIDLQTFPGMPENMSETYFEMINSLLTYKPKKRKPAGDVLQYEFVKMHQELLVAQDKKITPSRKASMTRTPSVLFTETGKRHTAYMNYMKYERAVTTILATIPSREELSVLLQKLDEQKHKKTEIEIQYKNNIDDSVHSQQILESLDVIEVDEMKEILLDMGLVETSTTIEQLPNSQEYAHHSFHLEKLREFTRLTSDNAASSSGGSSKHHTIANFTKSIAAVTEVGIDVVPSSSVAAAGGGKHNNVLTNRLLSATTATAANNNSTTDDTSVSSGGNSFGVHNNTHHGNTKRRSSLLLKKMPQFHRSYSMKF